MSERFIVIALGCYCVSVLVAGAFCVTGHLSQVTIFAPDVVTSATGRCSLSVTFIWKTACERPCLTTEVVAVRVLPLGAVRKCMLDDAETHCRTGISPSVDKARM